MGQSVSTYIDSRSYLHAAEQGEVDKVAASLHSNPGQAKLHLLKASKHNACHPTAWHLAAQHGHLDILKMIVEQIRDWSQSPDFSSWVITCNAGESLEEVIASLVNSRNGKGQTPLMLAAGNGHASTVSYLLENGADPWASDRLGARTAIHYAAKNGHVDTIKVLLADSSADANRSNRLEFPNPASTRYIDVRSTCGFTPLHHAIVCSQVASVELLLSLGADPTFRSLYDGLDWIRCTRGSSALHLAARKGNAEMCKLLIRAQVERWPNLPDLRLALDARGRAPYTVALHSCHWQLAELLQPTVPLSAILSPGELSLLGPPRLAQLAATAVQQKLLAALQAMETTAGSSDAAPAAEEVPAQHPHLHDLHHQQQACSSSAVPSSSKQPLSKLVMLRMHQQHHQQQQQAGHHDLASSLGSDFCPYEQQGEAAGTSAPNGHFYSSLPKVDHEYCSTPSARRQQAPLLWLLADGEEQAEDQSCEPELGLFGEDLEEELQLGAGQEGAAAGSSSSSSVAATSSSAQQSAWLSHGEGCAAGSSSSGAGVQQATCASHEEDEEDVCGVCLEAVNAVELRPCGHLLCVACTKELAGAMTPKLPARCPFCRTLFGSVSPHHHA